MEKIRKSSEFDIIYNKAKKVYTGYAIIFMYENNNKGKRFGFVASKKTGKAVQRNRIKRLFREFARKNEKKLKDGRDYIFVGKAILKDKAGELSYNDIERDLIKVVRK